MRCLFCKADSSLSRSREHIIPESLGNIDHQLPAGNVCDACNHYLGREVERPVQESPLFRQLRKGMQVPNKRGKFPEWEPGDGVEKPSYRLMGRFLAKVALEAIAFRTREVAGSNEELVTKAELDELRRYARYNEGPDWPFTVRTLYPVNAVFQNGREHFELLHEFDILVTHGMEYYLVLALFGVELVINLGGRELDGYRCWLEAHDYASPLYTPKPPKP
ncbi:MAG: HNH endonuclease [Paludibaculum sp.]